MTDLTLDALLEAVRFLASDRLDELHCHCNSSHGRSHSVDCRWSNLDKLVEGLGDLAEKRRGRADSEAAKPVRASTIRESMLEQALKDLAERADRARHILRTDSGGFWGMLDTDAARIALAYKPTT